MSTPRSWPEMLAAWTPLLSMLEDVTLTGSCGGVVAEDLPRLTRMKQEAPEFTQAQVAALRFCAKGSWSASELVNFEREYGSLRLKLPSLRGLITSGFDLTTAGRAALKTVDAAGAK